MCLLCSNDDLDVKAGRANSLSAARLLRCLAETYDDLAAGRLKPHSDEHNKRYDLARAVIRELANDWL